jgi:threonine synthase
MGLPIRRLVLAANENNVLDEFFRTGVYRPRSAAQTLATSSPSMDISKASNLERFIYDLVGRDPRRVARPGTISPARRVRLHRGSPRFADEFGIVSGTSTHADRLATIRAVHETAARSSIRTPPTV